MGRKVQTDGAPAAHFTGCPARPCAEVSRLPKNVLVEVEVMAEKEYNDDGRE